MKHVWLMEKNDMNKDMFWQYMTKNKKNNDQKKFMTKMIWHLNGHLDDIIELNNMEWQKDIWYEIWDHKMKLNFVTDKMTMTLMKKWHFMEWH